MSVVASSSKVVFRCFQVTERQASQPMGFGALSSRGGRACAAFMLASTLLLFSGCAATGSSAELTPAVLTSVEESTREHMTAVAEQLGTDVSVRTQEWIPCLGSPEGSDRSEYVYGTRVELNGSESFDEIADRMHAHFEEEGWVWQDTNESLSLVRLTHEDYIVAASIFVDDGYASITGGAGCIGSIDDVPERDLLSE